MKERIVNFVLKNKDMIVKVGLLTGVAVGIVAAAAVVVNKMSDPDLLADQIIDDASDEASPE
jgi:hypothetical protein